MNEHERFPFGFNVAARPVSESCEAVYFDENPGIPPRKFIRGSRKWIKHVYCDGARFHVPHWNTSGIHCSEPDCVLNRPRKDTPHAGQ